MTGLVRDIYALSKGPTNTRNVRFHESCANLRDRPPSREPSPEHTAEEPTSVDQAELASNASSSGLPPPLIGADDYESFVCQACVFSIPILKRWLGTPGTLMVVRDLHPGSRPGPWKALAETFIPASHLHSDEIVDVVDASDSTVTIGSKRSHSPSGNEPDAKKPRVLTSTSSSSCTAPPQGSVALEVLTSPDRMNYEFSPGTGDLFLTDGFRERWCRCDKVIAVFASPTNSI